MAPGIAQRLVAEGVGLVAATFVDNGGITRAKLVPVGRIDAAAREGIGASTTFSVFTGRDLMAPVRGLEVPTGDLRLMPDLAALAHDGSGMALAPADQHDQDGRPWPTCARIFARRMEAAAGKLGLRLQLAFETEWTAFDATGAAAHDGPAYGLDAARQGERLLADLLARLRALGVPVVQVHPEYAHGQFEVSIGETSPVASADRAVLARDAVRAASRACGLRASLSPKPRADALGNGAHVHLSLWRDGENLMAAGTAEAAAFLAGMLRELPALVAVGCASPVSYERLGPSRWAGAYACWGTENREAPIRVVPGTRVARAALANAELKTVDASGNPYLVAGCLVAAGLAGIASGAQLPPEVTVDPASLDEAEREAAGIVRLPATLADAAAALRGSRVLRAALGDVLHDVLCAVRDREAADATGAGPEELLATYRFCY